MYPRTLHLLSLCAGTALALATMCPTSLSAADLDKAIDEEILREAIVQATYDRLVEYTTASGVEFTAEVGDFVHIDSEDFDQHAYLDLVSQSQGLLVTMKRTVRTNGALNESRALFEPTLTFKGGDHPNTLTFHGKSFADFVAEVGRLSPEHEVTRIQSLVAFKAQVAVDGVARTYSAAFGWIPNTPQNNKSMGRNFFILDQVTQGVEKSAREPNQPLREVGFSTRLPDVSKFTKTVLECKVDAKTEQVVRTKVGTEGHLDGGRHFMELVAQKRCTCNTSCQNTCEVEIETAICKDEGWLPTDWCHKMSEDAHEANKTTIQTANTCSAYYICGKQNCPFCACGTQVSIVVEPGGVGAGVTFGTGGTDWHWADPIDHACGPCTVIGIEPPDGGGGSGNDNGSTGSGDGSSGGGGGGGDTSGGDSGGGSCGQTGDCGDPTGGGGGNTGGGDSGGGGTGGGDSGGDGGGGGGGDDDTLGFPVYCGDSFVGYAHSVEEATAMCEQQGPPDNVIT